MLCRLCCEECLDFEDLYDKDDQENYIYQICQKFFLREMEKLNKTLDNCSKIICDTCWKSINEFNEFYEKIVAQQTAYCKLIVERKSLELPVITDSITVKNGEGVIESELLVDEEFLRESPVERLKSCEFKDDSYNKDTFMITTNDPEDSVKLESEISILDDNFEIKVEEEFIDIRENELNEDGDDDASQSFSNSSLAKYVTEDCDTESKEKNKESGVSSLNEFQEKRIEEIKNKLLNGEWEVMFRCDLCEYFSIKYSQFTNHYKTTHPGNLNSPKFQKPFECEVCQKSFACKKHLKRHYQTHIKGPRNYECSECDKRFTSSEILQRHYKFKHTNNKWICDLCGIKVSSSDSLVRHKRTTLCKKRQLELEKKSRDIKGKTQTELKNLDLDSLLVDRAYKIKKDISKGNWKPILRCDLCEYSSESRTAFRTHYKEVHPENLNSQRFQKPFECEICHNCFTTKYGLQKHYLYTHEDS